MSVMRLKSRNKYLFYKPTPTPLHWRGSDGIYFLILNVLR